VLASFGAEHGRGTEERDGGRRWLLIERKREKGRGSAWATPHRGRRGGALARSRHTEEDSMGGGGRLAVGKARGRWRRWPVSCLPREQGSGAARVSQPGKEGAGPGPIEHC
jgi:hypothetical protein